MYLLVQPNGGKWWRLKYRIERKEKLISLGVYPAVSLKAARDKRDDARKQLAAGIDPGQHRKAAKSAGADRRANSFEVVAREWFGKFSPGWAKNHADKIIRRLERDVFPWLGNRPVSEVSPADVLEVLRRIEKRGALETAHRIHQNVGQVFRYAIATGRVTIDPSAALKGALQPARETHHAAITDPKAVGGLMRAIEDYGGAPVTKAALKLAPMLFVRPGELRAAEWSEFDLDEAQWNIPAVRMKTAEPHLVPLAKQAVSILRELRPLTGAGRYVFPGARTNGRPLSDNAINAALRRMGFEKGEMTGHGFRAMARTILDEVLHVRPDYIEHQLAHAVKDPNGRAYNRTAHLPARRKMMQDWANYLDAIAISNVVPMRASKP
jgi:integrase